MRLGRFRDLLLLEGEERLVVACDSVGSIGPKPADTFKVPAVSTAHFAVRVPLLEVLCVGAKPLVIVDALCVEMDGIGQEMIAEVLRLAATVGVGPEGVTGTTEDNVPTNATGIGVTVIAELPDGVTVERRTRPGDVVVCVGLPLSAPTHSLYPGHPGQVTLAETQALYATGLVHDALPVGSRGVEFEVGELIGPDLVLEWTDTTVDRTHSGGPASCVLFSCVPPDLAALHAVVDPERPWTVLGTVRTRGTE